MICFVDEFTTNLAAWNQRIKWPRLQNVKLHVAPFRIPAFIGGLAYTFAYIEVDDRITHSIPVYAPTSYDLTPRQTAYRIADIIQSAVDSLIQNYMATDRGLHK